MGCMEQTHADECLAVLQAARLSISLSVYLFAQLSGCPPVYQCGYLSFRLALFFLAFMFAVLPACMKYPLLWIRRRRYVGGSVTF